MTSELLRRLGNIVQIGTVTESKSIDGYSLARVNILGRVSDFLPFMQSANSFKRVASPVRVGEQVIILSPYGNADGGVILGAIFNKNAKEPAGYSNEQEVCEYEDGTRISYNTQTKELKVDASDKILITCKSATVNAKSVSITATTSHSGDVSINGNLTLSGDFSNGGNITTGGTVSDVKGDLTNFSTTDGAARA